MENNLVVCIFLENGIILRRFEENRIDSFIGKDAFLSINILDLFLSHFGQSKYFLSAFNSDYIEFSIHKLQDTQIQSLEKPVGPYHLLIPESEEWFITILIHLESF
jgi:hypothetical protein